MKLFTTLVLAAATWTVQAAVSAQQTVYNIDNITSLSVNLDSTAKSVTTLTGLDTAPDIIAGFRNIAKVARSDYSQMASSSSTGQLSATFSYNATEQMSICNAYAKMATAQDDLLATMMQKHEDFGNFSKKAAKAMNASKVALDNLSAFVIEETKSCNSSEAMAEKKLDRAYSETISEYMDD